MAASDYKKTGKAAFVSHALLDGPVTHLQSLVSIRGITSPEGERIAVGMVALLGDEFTVVSSIIGSQLGLHRGCADTIPEAHSDGTEIWFFDFDLGSDFATYSAGTTVGVKLLPYSVSGAEVPVEAAPAYPLTFNWRHARPYPPGDFKVRGVPWFQQTFVMLEAENDIAFSWAHRDRLLQLDQVVPHTAASIGPEPGVTYTARVYDSRGTLRRTEVGIAGSSWQYTRLMAEDDLLIDPIAAIDICSTRGGLDSKDSYRTNIEVLGLVFGEDESEFNFKVAGYVPPASDTIANFNNAGYIPPTSE